MAKLSTPRKPKNKKFTTKQLLCVEERVNHTVKYIKQWKRKELSKIVSDPSQKSPVCVAVDKDTYIVGYYGVKLCNGEWVVFNAHEDKEYYFSRKSTAMTYSVCMQNNLKSLALGLLEQDTAFLKLTDKIRKFDYSKEKSTIKKDFWRLDFFSTMRSNAKLQLDEVNCQIMKSLCLAKYFKVWEQHYES